MGKSTALNCPLVQWGRYYSREENTVGKDALQALWLYINYIPQYQIVLVIVAEFRRMGYSYAFLGIFVVQTGHIGVASTTVLGETPSNSRKQPKT